MRLLPDAEHAAVVAAAAVAAEGEAAE